MALPDGKEGEEEGTNITILECKQGIKSIPFKIMKSINITILECKQDRTEAISIAKKVLI